MNETDEVGTEAHEVTPDNGQPTNLDTTTSPTDIPQEQPVTTTYPQETLQNEPPAVPKRGLSKKMLLMVGVILLNVLVAGTTGYMFVKKPNTLANASESKVAPANAEVTPSAKKLENNNKTVGDSPSLKILHYVTNSKNIEFDYPSDWSIHTSPDDSQITLNSGKFVYSDEAGKEHTDILYINIENKDLRATGFEPVVDQDTASDDSLKIVYKNPTTIQRKETYITFSGNGAIITGNNVYKKGEQIGSKNLSKIDPFISVYTNGCEIIQCQNLTGDTLNTHVWQNTEYMVKAQAVIESLRFNK